MDLGQLRSDIYEIRLVSRADSSLWQSQGINVYVSQTTDFMSNITGVAIMRNVTFDDLGVKVVAGVPVNTTMRYDATLIVHRQE